jgi:hypothetical protein
MYVTIKGNLHSIPYVAGCSLLPAGPAEGALIAGYGPGSPEPKVSGSGEGSVHIVLASIVLRLR